ncbi:MAG: hypothetical protein GF368_01805 [Candidatus Aenigmarchaeota archaeon]|nr:hypothetical protein [Candidatus Aenigmarchaeota archaeon]
MLVPLTTVSIIIIFGIWTSYTDIKYGKIKNITILFLLILGFLVNTFLTRSLVNSIFLFLVNSGLSLIIGFLMWNFGLWSAGDAKLFFAFSFLLPLGIYKSSAIEFFPSFTILINTFVPAGIFLFLYSISRMKSEYLKREIKSTLSFKRALRTFLFTMGYLSILIILQNLWNLEVGLIFQLLFMFLFFEIINKLEKKVIESSFLIVVVLGFLIYPKEFLNYSFLRRLILIFIFFQGIRLLITCLNNFVFSKKIKIDDLKPGMILSENIRKIGEKYSTESTTLLTYFDIIKHVQKKASADFKGKLSEKDVKRLKNLKKLNELNFDSVKVVETIPFAPFMFLGVLVTYITGTNVLLYFIIFKDVFWIEFRLFLYNIFS